MTDFRHEYLQQVSFEMGESNDALGIEGLLNRTVLMGGKRFRPLLLMLMGRFIGLDVKVLAPYARAVELTHAATLSHDDVIDEARERRSRRTLNAEATNAHAVLAGDYLLSRVMFEISSLGVVPVIQGMSEALRSLVQGEWMQLESRGVFHDDWERLVRTAKLKTGSLIEWASVTPFQLMPYSENALSLAQKFGECLGVAFQMIDDVIDFEVSTGKEFAKDFREGLVNFVVCEMIREELVPVETLKAAFHARNPDLLKPLWIDLACRSVRTKAHKYLNEAQNSLNLIAEELPGEILSDDSRLAKSRLDIALIAMGARED